jgi:hypothetical protein
MVMKQRAPGKDFKRVMVWTGAISLFAHSVPVHMLTSSKTGAISLSAKLG